ncbi:kinase-like domain-containing protein [Leptodontidium sp. MPI-SDFR-AT-0119]|nr:kinase-like domain-containing protein [Leptodontidium sp. MPI-SDFR-AT-0119]
MAVGKLSNVETNPDFTSVLPRLFLDLKGILRKSSEILTFYWSIPPVLGRRFDGCTDAKSVIVSTCTKYVINSAVVLKVPIRYNNPDTTDIADHAGGIESLDHEKAIYEVLNERKFKHPNLLRCILAIPEGIFLERLATILEFRNRNREKEPVSESTAIRWTAQLVSAEAYLEELGYIHGDLRPSNILLTKEDHVKLCDFDATVRPGERLRTATPGFSQVSDLKTFQPCMASCSSEQLAIGSCIFAIGTGTEPLQDAVDQVQRFFWNDFPSTHGVIFGEVIQNCWRKRYSSIVEVKHAITADLSAAYKNVPVMDNHELELRIKECQEFLQKNADMDGDSICMAAL